MLHLINSALMYAHHPSLMPSNVHNFEEKARITQIEFKSLMREKWRSVMAKSNYLPMQQESFQWSSMTSARLTLERPHCQQIRPISAIALTSDHLSRTDYMRQSHL